MLVSIGFSSTIFENSQASGDSAPEPSTNPYDNIFLNYWNNFREKLDKIILKIWKYCKNSIRIIKKSEVSIDFSTQIPSIR